MYEICTSVVKGVNALQRKYDVGPHQTFSPVNVNDVFEYIKQMKQITFFLTVIFTNSFKEDKLMI